MTVFKPGSRVLIDDQAEGVVIGVLFDEGPLPTYMIGWMNMGVYNQSIIPAGLITAVEGEPTMEVTVSA